MTSLLGQRLTVPKQRSRLQNRAATELDQAFLFSLESNVLFVIDYKESRKLETCLGSIKAKLRQRARKYRQIFKPEIGYRLALGPGLHPAGLEPATL
jgi:hypothetical protein